MVAEWHTLSSYEGVCNLLCHWGRRAVARTAAKQVVLCRLCAYQIFVNQLLGSNLIRAHLLDFRIGQ